MLDNTRPRSLRIRIVHCRIALEIRDIQHFGIKAHRTILQNAQRILKIRIDRAGVNYFLCHRIPISLILKIILFQANLDAVQHIGNHLRIAAHRDSLIQGVKIVVVKGQTDRKTLDDEGWKILALSSPLLLCIALDQLLINIRANQADRLLFQVLRLRDACCLALFLDLRRCLLRSHDTPHLVERIHIERQGIQLAVVIRHRGVRKTIKLRELVHITPDLFIIRMENMRAILVDLNALHRLCIHISCNIRAAVNHQNLLARFLRLMGEYGTVETGAYY